MVSRRFSVVVLTDTVDPVSFITYNWMMRLVSGAIALQMITLVMSSTRPNAWGRGPT